MIHHRIRLEVLKRNPWKCAIPQQAVDIAKGLFTPESGRMLSELDSKYIIAFQLQSVQKQSKEAKKLFQAL